MKSLFRFLIVGTGLLACAGGVAVAQESPKPLVMPEGEVRLPARQVSAYSLDELARFLGEQSGKAFFVDKRVAPKKLLIQSPDNFSRFTFGELTEAMRLATGLQWRQVDNVFFLSLYHENALRDFTRKMTEEDRKRRTDIFDMVQKNSGDKIPATLDDFVKGGRPWDKLTPAQQDKYFAMFQNAEKTSGQADWTKEGLAGGHLWLLFDLDITYRYGSSGSGRAVSKIGRAHV